MADGVTTGTAASAQRRWLHDVADRLDTALADLAERGIVVDRRGIGGEGPVLVGYRFSVASEGAMPSAELRELCRRQVARALSDLIVDVCEPELVREIVRRHYASLPAEEQDQVVRAALDLLAVAADGPLGPSRATRKARVYLRLLEHLQEHDELNLDGFIRFRLKDYLEQLEDAVDRAVDEHLMEREYREFLDLLRRFVEVQEPRLRTVHVRVDVHGACALLDAEGRPLDRAVCPDVSVCTDGEPDADDLLLSALISLAPQRLLLHDPSGRLAAETRQTLSRVFEGGFEECPGCRICRSPHAE